MQPYFTILELPSVGKEGHSIYRGLMRLGPVPAPNDSEPSPFMMNFLTYCENNERCVFLEDLIPLWNSLGERQREYEVVLVSTLDGVSDFSGMTFLGCDITTQGGWNSVLNRNWSDLTAPWDELRVFVNDNELIDTPGNCRRVVSTLEEYVRQHPGTIESPEAEVFAEFLIYKVR